MAKKKGSQRKEVQEAMSNPFTGESPMVSLELDFSFFKMEREKKEKLQKASMTAQIYRHPCRH